MAGEPSAEALAAALVEAGSLLDLDGVEGVGEGATEDGASCILLLTTAMVDLAGLPDTIGGFPVRVLDVGEPPTAHDHEAVETVELPTDVKPDCG
ncbi:MAG: hypothetical protein ABWY62_01205 [Acidimicrobiia bacterium]